MITRDYFDNRARFPITELNTHRGEWVAFSPDGMRIVARAATLELLEGRLREMGVDGQSVVFESVAGPDDDVYLGAGELM